MEYAYGEGLNVTEDEKNKLAYIASLSYESDLTILEKYNLTIDFDLSDVYSTVLTDNENVYVSIRGTADAQDVFINDVALIFGRLKMTPRYKREIEKLRSVRYKHLYKTVVLTGHSLGGLIALNLTYNFYNLVDKCVVFNPGFSVEDFKQSLVRKIASYFIPEKYKTDAIRAYENKIKIYHQKYDPISVLSRIDDNTETIQTQAGDNPHTINNFIGAGIDTASPDYRTLMLNLIQQYRPDFYLSSNEKFNPCSFDFMFSYMTLENNKMVITPPLTKPNEIRDWFYGDINNAPFYVFTSIKDNILTLKYYILYAYNKGKYILPLNKEIGNHVSDLEHAWLKFDVSGDEIKPIQAGNMYHSHFEEYPWDGSKLSYYIANGSHGVYRSRNKQYYDSRLKLLNVFDDTTKCNKLFDCNKYVVFDDANYNGSNNIAFNESGSDVSLELPAYNINNWINQVTGFGSLGKMGVIKLPFKLGEIAGNTGTIKNPSLNML